jgi:hypothetical protein
MPYKEFLGRVGNVVVAATGVHIPLTDCNAVTWACFLDAGTQSITLKESIDGASEQNLAVIDRLYKGPGIGGTWTLVTQTAAATFDLTTDATNDCFVFTVGAEQLSAGFNCLEVTQSSGTCVAITHDLKVQRDAAALVTSVDV